MDKYINQILVGDCLKVLPQLPSQSVDVVFADPPFNLKKRYGAYKDHKAIDDYLNWISFAILFNSIGEKHAMLNTTDTSNHTHPRVPYHRMQSG